MIKEVHRNKKEETLSMVKNMHIRTKTENRIKKTEHRVVGEVLLFTIMSKERKNKSKYL